MVVLKKYKKILLLGIFLLNSLISYSFRLENIHFNRRMDGPEGGYREFRIVNNSLSKQRYKIRIVQGKKNDASKFIEVFPKILTIEPKEVGLIKVFAKAPEGTEKGEYNFGMVFQGINIPTLAKAKTGKIEGVSNVALTPEIGLKAYVGDVDFSEAIRLEDIEVVQNTDGEGIVVKGTLSNDSYASVDLGLEAYGKSNRLYGTADVGGELYGNTREEKKIFYFPMIKDVKELKKIVFYRTPSRVREVLKEIELDKN